MDMSAHPGDAERAGPVGPERLLTLDDAARVAGGGREAVLRLIRGGRIEVTVRDGVHFVAVGDLIRIGWLDREGRPPTLPDKLGCPC